MRPKDEDLILHYYGESPDDAEIERQLQSSPELQRRFEQLRHTLDAVQEPPVPGRPATYGVLVWQKLTPRLEKKRLSLWSWHPPRPRRQWAMAGAMMLLVAVAFLIGRFWPRPESELTAALSSDGRERILLMTVAGHLERSEMLLVELVNTRQNGEVDLSVERQLADELGEESRLYRQAAVQAGRVDIAAVLEQLETVLVELANSPRSLPSSELGELRLRLDQGNLIFKVRVVGTRLLQEATPHDEAAKDKRIGRDI